MARANAVKWNANGADIIGQVASKFQFDAMVKFEDEAINMAGGIISSSPVGININGTPTGNYKNNWQIAAKPNNRVLKGNNRNKGGEYAEKKIRGFFAKVSKQGIKSFSRKSLFLFNNSPYGRVIEFGGYPQPVKKGTYVRGRGYEKRSQGGYSKQAPGGHVRKGFRDFRNRLRARLAR